MEVDVPRTSRTLAMGLGLALALTLCRPVTAGAAEPGICSGSTSLGRFRFLVQPNPKMKARPLAAVNRLEKGRKLLYIPVRLRSSKASRATITLVLVPAGSSPEPELLVLDPRPAAAATQWDIPFDVGVVGMVYGPRGLNIKKVNALVEDRQDLIVQLADYAEQTAQVGALVETLAAWERSPANTQPLDAVLQGFSSQHNINLPRLDPNAPANQQAARLLRTLLPSLTAYDPLNPQPTHDIQQSAGLAASLATLFLGHSAVLATGGAALFQNLRTLIAPGTEFRSAFARKVSPHDVDLCSQARPTKTRARMAYLWALRIPSQHPPQVKISPNHHLPLGLEASLPLSADDASHLRRLPRAHDWKLVSVEEDRRFAVRVSPEPSLDTLKLDTGKEVPPPGEYTLAASWDWEPFELGGRFQLHPLGDLGTARVTPESRDRLVARSGLVNAELTASDFQFVEKLELIDANAPEPAAVPLPFRLSPRKPNGQQKRLTFQLDTAGLSPGRYRLLISQAGDVQQDFPLDIHPPLPQLINLPLRVNLEEVSQQLPLKGIRLERISRLGSASARWELAPTQPGKQHLKQRKATVYLEETAQEGDLLPIKLTVPGLEAPITLEQAVQVVGPRPIIPGAETSFPAETGLGLRSGEIPAGLPVSFAIRVEHLGSPASLVLGCHGGERFQPMLTLSPGERRGTTQLDLTGRNTLFLSLDPGSLSPSTCSLSVVVANQITGSSDPYSLGRVVRLPRIERFVLTSKKLGESLYEGILTGEELHHIVETGWNPRSSVPVVGIPARSLHDPQKQTLRIALPWPSPEPHAPVFIWLRGEENGRPTQARY